ncbi:TPA: type II toxin-antitoxin system RelE/ParE family toxin [Vibrio vulnificus]|uniref:type II toxin-antitoxin system RelE/ParE family toxin n=1 Tax=Vibrio vulnificus TaxID=672 RepID=UPI00324287D7
MNQVKPVRIRVAEAFEKTLDNTITFLSQWSDEEIVITKAQDVIKNFQLQIEEHPFIYSRSPELMELGINSVRHAVDNGFRILYEVIEYEDEITVDLLLFLRTKQNIQQQLIEYCLYQ